MRPLQISLAPLQRIFVALAVLAALPPGASAAGSPYTKAMRTDNGCIFYLYPEYEVTQSSWSGKCAADKEISGKGELRFEARLVDPKDGFLGTRVGVMVGEMRKGLLEGKASQSRTYFDANQRKVRELRETAQVVGGLANGPGERVIEFYRADSGKLNYKQTITGNFINDALNGQGRVKTERQSGFSQGNIEEGLFENGVGKQTTSRFLGTLLGGDLVVPGVNYELPSGKPLNQVGFPELADKDVLVGHVERPAGKLPIRLRKSNLNVSFLNEFEVFRENWNIVCLQPQVQTGTLGCMGGEVHVKRPKFDFVGTGIELELSDLDSNEHPARQLEFFVEKRKAEQEAREAAAAARKAELEKNTYSESNFSACVRDADRLLVDQNALQREFDALEKEDSSLSFLENLIQSTRAAGFRVDNAQIDNYNSRARQRNAWNKNLHDQKKRLQDRQDRLFERCNGKEVLVPMFEKYCTNNANVFCKSFDQ